MLTDRGMDDVHYKATLCNTDIIFQIFSDCKIYFHQRKTMKWYDINDV